MAKKKIAKKKKVTSNVPGSNQPPLDPEWEDQIPEEVAMKVDEYLKLMRQRNRLNEKERNAREAAIDAMREHGLKKIRIDEGQKWLICEDKHALKTKKVNLEKDDTRQAVSA